MKISTKIWLLPIGVGVAFGLSLVLGFVLNHRSATHLEMLRSVDNPYLEHMLRVEGSIEDLRIALQSAVAEGDPDKLQDARKAGAAVRKALAGIVRLEGQPKPVAALAAAFDDYEASALAATRALLNHEELDQRVLHMQAAQQTLGRRTSDMLTAARAAIEQRFSSVARSQQLGQWASAVTALLVLVGLAVGSRLIIGSVWRELQAVHNQLVAAARVAGMAEVATNVLHNVGNVLNSVNVSAGLIASSMRASKVQGLTRAVQLMNEHADDLGAFLTRDAKGRMLPGYLGQLSQVLATEQQGVIEELAALTRSVDHVKEIIAMQQAHAGASSLVEPVLISDLIEDALRMNAATLMRRGVTVQKAFAGLPELPLDKGRILQILVNLIGNAAQATQAAADREARLTLSVELVEGGRLRVSVADNGVGIAPENLTRVFAHGFTTKKDGHGFGLHSAVIAAREMGGTLTAHSDGPGTGARFVLELPIETTEKLP